MCSAAMRFALAWITVGLSSYTVSSPLLISNRGVLGSCKVFTLLSMFSLITIELEPDIFYIKGVLNDSCDGL